jgi:hypothetical protein
VIVGCVPIPIFPVVKNKKNLNHRGHRDHGGKACEQESCYWRKELALTALECANIEHCVPLMITSASTPKADQNNFSG